MLSLMLVVFTVVSKQRVTHQLHMFEFATNEDALICLKFLFFCGFLRRKQKPMEIQTNSSVTLEIVV